MVGIRLTERWTRRTGGSFLVYHQDEDYDVAARYAGPLIRRGVAEKLPEDKTQGFASPEQVRVSRLDSEEIQDLERDTLRNKRDTSGPSETADEGQAPENASTSEDEDAQPDEEPSEGSVNPLTVSCPYCGAGTSIECETESGNPTDPHQDRIDKAQAEA